MRAWRTKVTPGVFLSEGLLPYIICDGLRALWLEKPKIQISCRITFIREGIIFWPNSVRAPRWINCCCIKCPSASALKRDHVSARLRRNHQAVWIIHDTEDLILQERERPSINLYPPSHISPSWRRRQPWDSNEGRQAAHKQPRAARRPPSIDFFNDPRQEYECSIPNTWRTWSHSLYLAQRGSKKPLISLTVLWQCIIQRSEEETASSVVAHVYSFLLSEG